MERKYAGVIVDVRAEAVNRIFQYAIPEKYQRSLEIGIGCWFPLAVDGWKAMWWS